MLNSLLYKRVILKGPDNQRYTAKFPRFPSLNGTQPVTVRTLGQPLGAWTGSERSVVLNAVGSDKSTAERTLSIVG